MVDFFLFDIPNKYFVIYLVWQTEIFLIPFRIYSFTIYFLRLLTDSSVIFDFYIRACMVINSLNR